MKLARTATAIAAAAAVVLLPSAANAASLLRTDGVGDVQLVTFDPSNPDADPTPVPAPTRTIGDITKTRITHSATTVRVEMYYKALPKAGSFNSHEFRFVTNTTERDVSIEAGTGHWAGAATMYTKSGSESACKTMKYLIDYPNHRVILTVPRTCLANPKFVKVGAGFIAVAGTKLYFDDAQVTGGGEDDLTLSPGVFRG